MAAACTFGSRSPCSGLRSPSTAFSSGSSCDRVSTFSSVTLASASGEGSFIEGMSEPPLLGAQAQRPGDLLDVGELLSLGQAAQLTQHVAGGVTLLRLGDQGVAVGRPDLLAQGLG